MLRAFGASSRFFHLEFFRLTEDKPGLGKRGDIVALEVNMRPAGGYTPDMLNFSQSVDVYQMWADMWPSMNCATAMTVPELLRVCRTPGRKP